MSGCGLYGCALRWDAPRPGPRAASTLTTAPFLSLTLTPPSPPHSKLATGAIPGPGVRDVPSLLGVTNLYFLR